MGSNCQNALDLCPLLWQHVQDNQSAIKLLEHIAANASSKECIIALHEIQEILLGDISKWHDDEEEKERGFELIDRVCLLLDLYTTALPRVTLRRKGPLETIKPLAKGISSALRAIGPAADKLRGRKVLVSTSTLISSIVSWAKSTGAQFTSEVSECKDLLTTLLLSSVASYHSHLHSRLSEGYIEIHLPRRYLHSTLDEDSKAGEKVASTLISCAKGIDVTPNVLTRLSAQGGTMALSCVVLLAHWPLDEYPAQLDQLSKLEPAMQFLLQKGTATDECTFLVLSRSNSASSGELDANLLAHSMVTLASSNPDPIQRNSAFVALSLLVRRIPPTARLGLFAELLSPDDPFPQMRVAAVGLVKESVFDSLSVGRRDVFGTNAFLGPLGRYLLRSDPVDLFEHPLDVKEFFSSTEPARLVECLGFYYTLLQRDAANKTGIKDRASVSDTKRSLLDPLVKALRNVPLLEDAPNDAQMSKIALEIALDRVLKALGQHT